MTLLPGLVAMKVNTACCFFAAGICLSILRAPAAQWQLIWLARGLAAGVAIIGGLSFAENVLDQDFGIDQFILRDNWQNIPTPHPGRMAVVAGSNFVLIGLALLCLKSHRPRLATCAQWIVAPALFISLLAIVGYAYGIEPPDQMKHYNLMALHTILTFFVLALSIVAMDSAHGFANIAISDTAGGLVARWLLPAIPLVLVVLGGPGLMGERAGLYAFSFGLALNVVLSTTVGVIAISMTAATLHRVDLRRRHIEAELIGINVNLERRVAERTEQLDAANRSVLRDASARRQAQEALKESEALYRMLADTTSDVIMQLDLNMRRVYVSPACRLLVGYGPEEMIGHVGRDHVHPEDVPEVYAKLQAIVSGSAEGDTGRATYRVRHKDGHWVWVDASASLLRDAEGKPKTVITSLRDVTERQRFSRHLERAKAVAENATRQKSEFVANMSHELRTPLTGILGIHDLLQRDPTLGPQQRRYLDMARDAGRSLLSIVNDVLDFSKIEAGQLAIEKVPFRLSALVEACGELAAETAKKKALAFTLRTGGADLALMGDPARLRQVLLNLMTNAVKFTSAGGITVEVSYWNETSRMRIEVTDTGIGIPEDKLPLLFGRFSQADASTTRRYGGTGLGLAICKRLVELMGGEIGVVSKEGQGSMFWFDLPLGIASAEGERPAAASSQKEVSLRHRVLLAEDNIVNQEIIAAMLTQRGHAVTVVDNGAAAAAAARAQPPFDLILMDLQMPVMDGLSATRVIRASEAAEGWGAVPIVGLTANAMLEDVERCLEAGMMAHVAKPIDWAELFVTVDRVIAVATARTVPAAAAVAGRADVLDLHKLEELSGVIGPEDRTSRPARRSAEVA